MRRLVRRYEGAEVKTEGDSFYVVFESPLAALDCAVAILRAAAEATRDDPARPLHIGMGLHAGETVPFDDQFVGSAVNVAARLASKATAGELLISDTLRGLVRTGAAHPMSERGALLLKGVGERIRAWRVQWQDASPAPVVPVEAKAAEPSLPLPTGAAPPAVRAGELLCPVLIGRLRELETLEQLLAEAAVGRGSLVLVRGEAGVGKSALLREVQRVAVTRSFRLLSGVTLESDAGLPYAPFSSAIRAGYRDAGPAGFKRALERAAPDLFPLFPELGRSERGGGPSSTVERHRIALAFAALFASIADAAPVLLTLEDLHWADDTSLALVQHLAREATRARLLVVATYRSDEMHRQHPLLRVVASLRRDRTAHEIELSALGAEESSALIAAAAAGEHGITPELIDTISRRGQGNPLFMEELLRTVVHAGPRGGESVPATVSDVVRARLASLTPGARSTVAAASVLGERFPFALLRAVRGTDDVALGEELAACIDAHLLVELGDAREPSYAFRHALTREVVYEQMLLPERRRLHVLAAQALAPDPLTAPATLAEHWRLGGDVARAADAYEGAARSALALLAPTEAAAHVERAIEMRGTASLDHYELLARAYLFFDAVKAREAADRALEAAGDEPVLRRVRLMRIAGRARLDLGDAPGDARLAGQAWQLAEAGGDGAAHAEAADWLANAKLAAGDMAEATAWAARAAEAARASGELGIQGSAIAVSAAAIADTDPIAALRLLDDAAALARRTANAEVMTRVHQNGVVHSFSVEPERARLVRVERALEFARRYGLRLATIGAFSLFHDLLALRWPADAATQPADGDDAFGVWSDLVRTAITGARDGADDGLLGASEKLLARLRVTDPRSAVPWVGMHGILAAWAGDSERADAAYGELLGGTTHDSAPLGPTVLARGLNTPALLALLRGDGTTIEWMRGALGETAAFGGERDALDAMAAALAGGDPLPSWQRADAAYRRRGLRFTIALDLWALATVGVVDGRWSGVVDPAVAELRAVRATFLADEIGRLTR